MKIKTIIIGIVLVLLLLAVLGMVSNKNVNPEDNSSQPNSEDDQRTLVFDESDDAQVEIEGIETEEITVAGVTDEDLANLEAELNDLESEDLTGFSG